MANKNKQNNKTNDSTETPSSSVEQSEATTSSYHIKDGSIEKFTKVSILLLHYFEIIRQ